LTVNSESRSGADRIAQTIAKQRGSKLLDNPHLDDLMISSREGEDRTARVIPGAMAESHMPSALVH